MKRGMLVFLALAIMLIAISGCTKKEESLYNDGVFIGEGEGKYGVIKVEVTIDAGKIKEIKTLEHNETPGLSDPVFEKLYKSIIDKQTTEVDVISGGTVTSDGIKLAVADALAKALKEGAVVKTTSAAVIEKDTVKNEDIQTDVLVIGAGGAGLTAAISAAENNANVILIEKLPFVGGNTQISATGITASDTVLHEASGISFTVEDHIKRTMDAGKDIPNIELVTLLAERSSDAVDWLISLGLEYKVKNEEEPFWIIPVEGHYGAQLVAAMKAEASKYSNLEIKVENKAIELIYENNAVVGAVIENAQGTYNIYANNVVLATGGMNNNPELIAEYNPKYKGIHTGMTTPGATGDGVIMARAIDANLIDMEHFQVRPLSLNGEWYRETILTTEGTGGILVNLDGERFANETLSPKELVTEILSQKEKRAFFIFDQEMAETNDAKKAITKGNGVSADTIEALAGLIGIDPKTLMSTVETYNEGTDAFSRKTMGKIKTGPYYAVLTEPSNHYTMGGVEINKEAQVIGKNGEPIKGLFAAGEVVGGLYGPGRVAGNNTLDDIVFGKIAGKNASK